ncbi:phosphatase PAP2 family protein [soil metagenome]
MQKKIFQILGVAGTLVCTGIFIRQPSWPTPDKLLILATFIFMIFGQGWAVLKRLVPFVGALLVYESFRGIVPSLNKHVHFQELISADRLLFFGRLPTKILQNWLWHGHVQWYDFLFYLVYMMHFILPLSLALLIWKTREKYYWRYVASFLGASFAGFFTFLLFPAAPPWMAAQNGLIEPITRVSTNVFFALGIHDFPSVYNKISPNPVAAIPSLHAAYATLFFMYVYKLYGKKWAILASLYPLIIYVGTVYSGEHYVIDEIVGALFAVLAYFGINKLFAYRTKSAKHARRAK